MQRSDTYCIPSIFPFFFKKEKDTKETCYVRKLFFSLLWHGEPSQSMRTPPSPSSSGAAGDYPVLQTRAFSPHSAVRLEPAPYPPV